MTARGAAAEGTGWERLALAVAQVIAHVGQELDERNAEVSRQPLSPLMDKKRETIQHNPPETRIVFGQLVDIRFRQGI